MTRRRKKISLGRKLMVMQLEHQPISSISIYNVNSPPNKASTLCGLHSDLSPADQSCRAQTGSVVSSLDVLSDLFQLVPHFKTLSQRATGSTTPLNLNMCRLSEELSEMTVRRTTYKLHRLSCYMYRLDCHCTTPTSRGSSGQ